MSCPTNSTQTFPNTLVLPTRNAELYGNETTYTQTQLTFGFSEQRTPSTFRGSDIGVILPPSGLTNTVRYNGNTYTLQKLQFADAAHSTWILPTSEVANNREDFILTFEAAPGPSGPVSPAQIIIVIPILRTATASSTDPAYLKAMGPLGTYDFANPVSLANFFPPTKTTTVLTNTLHLYYTTCTQGKDVMVIVQVYGLKVSNALMDIVKSAYNNVGGLAAPFGKYEALQGTSFPVTPGSFDEAAFKQQVKHAFNLGEVIPTQPPPAASTEVVESVDAYKCVPFDPDTQVVNGKIKINTANGELVSQVEEDRKAIKKDAGPTTAYFNTAKEFIDKTTLGIGIFMAVTVFLILMYLLVFAGGGLGAEGERAGFLMRLWLIFWNKFLTPTVIGVVCVFVGFIVGFSLR